MLDALGHNEQPERAGEVDDRAHDDAVAVAAVDGAGEAAVDLQIIDRQPREQRQAGITGAAIVDRDRAAERADLRQLRSRARRGAEHSRKTVVYGPSVSVRVGVCRSLPYYMQNYRVKLRIQPL